MIPHAASRPGLSYLALDTRPGTSVRAGTIELLNPTRRTLRLTLAPVAGLTLDTLGSTYATGGTHPEGVARWLRVERQAVVLGPHRRSSVAVLARVPRDAAPGDYLGGVAVEDMHEARETAGDGAAAISAVRYAIGVEVSLPGPRHASIRFGGAAVRREPGGVSFLLLAHNLGNAILRGVHGHVRIEQGGRTVASRAIVPGTFVTHTSIAYPVPVPGLRPREGARFEISAWLRYGRKIARLHTTVDFGHRAAAMQKRYGGAGRGDGDDWWKDALFAALGLYMVVTTALLLRRRGGGRAPAAGAGG